MTAESTTLNPDPAIFGTIRDDLRRGDFGRTVRRDIRELKEYMLEEERQKQLKEMTGVWRWFVLTWWLLKSMFFKLTPTRRLLLVAGLLLFHFSQSVDFTPGDITLRLNTDVLSFMVILFVLMLELKDKLVAHDELRAGRAVQQALMPESKPIVSGWELWLFTRSANEVGGDLVDFMKIAIDRCGIAIGDVAGKGLSAALLTAKLQATLRALVADFTSLAGLGAKLNRIFCRDSLRNIFASLVYLELVPDSGSVRLVNAGHIPPVIMSGGKVQKTEKGSVALGIMPEAEFEEHRLELKGGDTLLVYSDGLTGRTPRSSPTCMKNGATTSSTT